MSEFIVSVDTEIKQDFIFYFVFHRYLSHDFRIT